MPGAVEPIQPVLETAAAALAEATAHPPYPFELPLAEGRRAVEEMQGCGVAKAVIEEEWITLPGGPTGSVRVRIVKPTRAEGALPVILCLHGAGRVFGGGRTHDLLFRELAVGVEAAVVFPEYALSLTLMANERGDVPLVYQLLFSPVTDAAFDTDSYHRFATGYFLRRDGMRWLWDQYTIDEAGRARITVSPLRASTEQLTGLPPALIITAEADVLRDEGEAYAGNLRAAGVPVVSVRFSGAINDLVVSTPCVGPARPRRPTRCPPTPCAPLFAASDGRRCAPARMGDESRSVVGAWSRGAPGVPADGEGRAIRLRGRPGAAGRGR